MGKYFLKEQGKKIIASALMILFFPIVTTDFCLAKSKLYTDRIISFHDGIDTPCLDNRNNILICAHRGFSSLYIENSRDAVIEAYESECVDICEVDIRLTKDGIPIVCHNENLFDTTGVEKNISDLTYEEILEIEFHYDKRMLDSAEADAQFDHRTGFPIRERIEKQKEMKTDILTLDELLIITGIYNKKVCLELCPTDNNLATMETVVADAIAKSNLSPNQIMIKSANHSIVNSISPKIDTDIECGLIIKKEEDLKLVKENKYDFYSINYKLLNLHDINSFNENTNIMLWTPNKYNEFDKVMSLINGTKQNINWTIITDYPDILCSMITFNNYQEQKTLSLI